MPHEFKASCLRRVANWSKIEAEHKIDKPTFSAEKVLHDLQDRSPKMKALLENIQKLDAQDMKQHGHHFKHFIFSDVKSGGYGAKIIASCLAASGKHLIYNKNHTLKSDNQLRLTKDDNFALLCSTAVFDKPIAVKTKKSIFGLYNRRPDNVWGSLLRFVVMDSGFKEGVDLFDVKYVHIFEPQVSKADQRQVIGRATRTCGQMGLDFNPKQGWPLEVFQYDVEIPEEHEHIFGNAKNLDTLFDLFLENSDIDKRLLVLADELDKYTIIGSVDYELNKNIHRFKIEDDEEIVHHFEFSGGDSSSPVPVACASDNCGKSRPTKEVPVSTIVMVLAAVGRGLKIPDLQVYPRDFFCKALKKDAKYCDHVRKAAKDPQAYVGAHTEAFDKFLISKKYNALPSPLRKEVVSFIDNVKIQLVMGDSTIPSISEKKTGSFVEMRNYVNTHYSRFTWPKVKLENHCGQVEGTRGGSGKIIGFTPTQDFVRHFFTPSNPLKGMLLNHSVGTGKTCCAIATATTTFEKAGYTILWVTRTTLKNDIWKNMFDQVCSLTIKEKLDKGAKIPEEQADRMKMLSNAWAIRPISYKQFTNLVEGKNQLYDRLVKRNGKSDPLRKTLLIIDEAHKLYGGSDLSAIERPNMDKLKAALMNSYKVSGKNSVKLMLMTATPYTNDPMELVKLVNLCKEAHAHMPDTYEAFSAKYLNSKEGVFSKKGKMRFLNDIAGYISYLNRERDARQFAQPRLHPMVVPKVTDNDYTVAEEIKRLENQVDKLESKLQEKKEAYQTSKEHLMVQKREIGEMREMKEGASPVTKRQIDINIHEERMQVDKELHTLKKNYQNATKDMKEELAGLEAKLNKLRSGLPYRAVTKCWNDGDEGDEEGEEEQSPARQVYTKVELQRMVTADKVLAEIEKLKVKLQKQEAKMLQTKNEELKMRLRHSNGQLKAVIEDLKVINDSPRKFKAFKQTQKEVKKEEAEFRKEMAEERREQALAKKEDRLEALKERKERAVMTKEMKLAKQMEKERRAAERIAAKQAKEQEKVRKANERAAAKKEKEREKAREKERKAEEKAHKAAERAAAKQAKRKR
jgi:hypothetical protein